MFDILCELSPTLRLTVRTLSLLLLSKKIAYFWQKTSICRRPPVNYAYWPPVQHLQYWARYVFSSYIFKPCWKTTFARPVTHPSVTGWLFLGHILTWPGCHGGMCTCLHADITTSCGVFHGAIATRQSKQNASTPSQLKSLCHWGGDTELRNASGW